jgi:uncharacterized membrane protein (UPF0127 family)
MNLTITNTKGQPVTLEVAVAESDAEVAQGLMHRESLPENEGMLFDYKETMDNREHWFWMSNTLIPLSIAFIDSDGKIVDIRDMEPLDETPVHAKAPYRYGLEANQGFFERNHITPGCGVGIL